MRNRVWPGFFLLLPSLVHSFSMGEGDLGGNSKGGKKPKYFCHGNIDNALRQVQIPKILVAVYFSDQIYNQGKPPKFIGAILNAVKDGNMYRDASHAIDGRSLAVFSRNVLAKGVEIYIKKIVKNQEINLDLKELGVYRPEEHVDNPWGYKSGKYHDKDLRGDVDPKEVEIDPKTGMKNYIANEELTIDEHGTKIDTSAGFVRKTLTESINILRKLRRLHPEELKSNKGKNIEKAKKSLMLLGSVLHCVQDFFAHSNYIELAFLEIENFGFPHVGDNTKLMIDVEMSQEGNILGSPLVEKKEVFPLVTGTFGETDFFHSLISGVTDKLEARMGRGGDSFPGKIKEFFVGAISSKLQDFAKKLIDGEKGKQYQVLYNPNAHDPTHSMLSKDHYTSIYNEPAGKLASISTKFVGDLWTVAVDNENYDINDICDMVITAVFYHPAQRYNDVPGKSGRQEIFLGLEKWWMEQSNERKLLIKTVTTIEGVRRHQHNQSMVKERGFKYEPLHSRAHLIKRRNLFEDSGLNVYSSSTKIEEGMSLRNGHKGWGYQASLKNKRRDIRFGK